MVIFVAVDGPIGCGKTTILRIFQRRGYIVEYQRLKEWTELEPYYADPKKHAMSLQRQVLKTYNDIKIKYKKDFSRKIVIIESFGLASFWSFAKMLWADKILSDDEMKELKGSLEHIIISLFIWIEVKPETSMERIKIRDRTGESSIKVEYLQSLIRHYEVFMKRYEYAFPIKKINNDTKDYAESIVDLIEFIYFKKKRIFDVALEGNIGSGKTTFGKKMQFKFIEQLLPEEILKLLDLRYTEKLKIGEWVMKLQSAFIKMYASQMAHCSIHNYNGWEGVLSLISVFTRAAKERGEITQEQMNELEKEYLQSGLPTLSDFKLVVWFRPSFDSLMHRILKRDRKGENAIHMDYIKELDQLYADYLLRFDNLLVIDNFHLKSKKIEKMIHAKLQEVYFK